MSSSPDSGLRRVWRAKSVLLRGAAVALVYHRISTPERDPERLAISPELFDEHTAALSENFNLIDAETLFTLLERDHKVPKRTVCITLDDGYIDALTAASPILHSYEAPATVFVSSGALVPDAMEFWWDELERLCLSANELPRCIKIASPNLTFTADLGDAANYDEESAARDASWNVTQPVPGSRQQLYLDLSEFLRSLAPAPRHHALESLRAQTGIPALRRETHRPMTAEELHHLAADGLIEIGGHTINHPVLSHLSPEEQRDQIAGDKFALEHVLRTELRLFSYPHGGWDDFGQDAVDIVDEVGYVGAFTARSEAIVPWTDRFRVPRFGPHDMPANELVATLDARFRGHAFS